MSGITIRQLLSGIVRRAAGWLDDGYFTSFEDYRPSTAGKTVSPKGSLEYPSVYACVNVISETLASLPWLVYERLADGKQRAPDHPLYHLLHNQPNPFMTSYQFRLLLQSHVLLWGNGYAEIEWGRDGTPKALWPLNPAGVTKKVERSKLWYEVNLPDGDTKRIPGGKVYHVYGLGDGWTGYSRIRLHREAIGLGLATEEFGSRFFSNGARPSGVLESATPLSPEAKKNLKDSWDSANGGLTKQQRVAVLENGIKYHQIGVPPEDAQFLLTRKFQKEEIASIFRVPLHLIQSLDHATNNNIEHQGLDFVINTMRPYLVMWEQEAARVFFDDTHFCEFLVDGLLRGDIKSRYDAYAVGRNWGWLSADDIRELENMNPLPDSKGQVYLQPLNMVEAGTELLPRDEEVRQLDTRNTRMEKRDGNSLLRHRTAESMKPVFRSAYQTIMRREKKNVLAAAKKHLRSEGDFRFWLEEFYRDFPDYVAKEMRAAVESLVGAIVPLAGEQVGIEDPLADRRIQEEVERHLKFMAYRYADNSRKQLIALIRDGEEEDAYELVEERLDEWEERRPDKETRDAVVRTAGRIAAAVFYMAGRPLVWNALGDKTCPYCMELDGQIVGRDEPFVPADGVLESEDGRMEIHKPTMTPPLHGGCVCVVDPG